MPLSRMVNVMHFVNVSGEQQRLNRNIRRGVKITLKKMCHSVKQAKLKLSNLFNMIKIRTLP